MEWRWSRPDQVWEEIDALGTFKTRLNSDRSESLKAVLPLR